MASEELHNFFRGNLWIVTQEYSRKSKQSIGMQKKKLSSSSQETNNVYIVVETAQKFPII
jgi:hypothetical protein